jgi:hypothetical protein
MESDVMAEIDRLAEQAPSLCDALASRHGALRKSVARWNFLKVCPEHDRGPEWDEEFLRIKALFDEAYPRYLEARAAMVKSVLDINRLLKTWEG